MRSQDGKARTRTSFVSAMPVILCNNNLACCPRDWWRNLPELSLVSPIDACMCQEYSFTFSVSKGLAPYTFTISSIPEGLSFDTATGTLSGIPLFADTYEFTIGVTDALGRTDERDYSLIVQPGSAIECGIELDAIAETAFDGTYVDLTWATPTDFSYADDSTIKILRDGELLVELALGVVTYRDETVESGQTYEYTVNFQHGSECGGAVVYAILEEGGGEATAILDEGGLAILEE